MDTSTWDLTVSPAFGKDYASANEVWIAWLAGKDFYIHTPGYPSYVNRADIERYDTSTSRTVRIRYKQLTEVLYVRLEGTKWMKGGSSEELDEVEAPTILLTIEDTEEIRG